MNVIVPSPLSSVEEIVFPGIVEIVLLLIVIPSPATNLSCFKSISSCKLLSTAVDLSISLIISSKFLLDSSDSLAINAYGTLETIFSVKIVWTLPSNNVISVKIDKNSLFQLIALKSAGFEVPSFNEINPLELVLVIWVSEKITLPWFKMLNFTSTSLFTANAPASSLTTLW